MYASSNTILYEPDLHCDMRMDGLYFLFANIERSIHSPWILFCENPETKKRWRLMKHNLVLCKRRWRLYYELLQNDTCAVVTYWYSFVCSSTRCVHKCTVTRTSSFAIFPFKFTCKCINAGYKVTNGAQSSKQKWMSSHFHIAVHCEVGYECSVQLSHSVKKH